MNRIVLGLLAAALLLAGLFYSTRRPEEAIRALEPDLHAPSPVLVESSPPLAHEPDAIADKPASAPAQLTARAELSPRPRPGPCRIDGVVLLRTDKDDSPLENADVVLREVSIAGAAGSNPEDEGPSHAVLARTRSGLGGRFAFEGLAGDAALGFGAEYRLEVRLISGAERDAIVKFDPGIFTARPFVIFGGARIHGVLRGIDGKPLGHVRVGLEFVSEDPVLNSYDWHATDPEGRYRFESLPAGQYEMSMGFASVGVPRGIVRTYRFQLTDRDDLVGDLGGAGLARVHGNLVAMAGEGLGKGADVHYSRTTRSADGVELRMFVDSYFLIQDGYDFPLEPASWTVSVSSNGHEWQLPAPLVIEGVDCLRDITLPTTLGK